METFYYVSCFKSLISFCFLVLFIFLPFWDIRKLKKYKLLTESRFLSFFLSFFLFVLLGKLTTFFQGKWIFFILRKITLPINLVS